MSRLRSTNCPPPRCVSPVGLTRLCLGGDDDRTFRHLAWTCSVCGLFVVLGLIGTGRSAQPKSSATQPKQLAPVVFMAESPAQSQPATTPNHAAPDATATAPSVSVTAAELPPNSRVAPLPASQLLRPASEESIPAPSAALVTAPAISVFKPGTGTAVTPQPAYPSLALRRGYEGTVVIQFTVTASGRIADARLERSSGHAVLDDAALATVRERWRFPAGPERHHFVEIVFQLR